MPEFAHDEATARRALDAIDQLLAAREQIATGEGGISFLKDQEAVAPAAWSWWMLIGDSARVVRAETMKGNGFVVAPVMRNLMTHAVALAWLVDGGETAVKALDAYSDEQLLNLITNAKEVGWDVGGDPAEARVRKAINDRVTDEPAVDRLKNEIRNTAQLMATFGEQDAYLPFRHLSSYSHTTRETARLYLAASGAHEIRSRPRLSGPNNIIWTAVCLIQSGRVIDSILTGQPLAESLDEVTASLVLSGDITPTRRSR
jgi:hypothetical protein